MTRNLKHSTQLGSLLLSTALICSFAHAQNTARPDLEGVWSNASLTNLTRRSGVDTLVVTPEDAQVIAASIPIGGIEGGFDEDDGVNNTPAVGSDDFGSRAYNQFWVDPGSAFGYVKGEYRTSWITYPESGRIPYSEEGSRLRQENRAKFSGNDGPEGRALGERCIIGRCATVSYADGPSRRASPGASSCNRRETWSRSLWRSCIDPEGTRCGSHSPRPRWPAGGTAPA